MLREENVFGQSASFIVVQNICIDEEIDNEFDRNSSPSYR